MHEGDRWTQIFQLGFTSLQFNLYYTKSFARIVKWPYALCTTELSPYETVSYTDTPVSNYWCTTVSYPLLSLHWGSITAVKRSTCCDRSHRGCDTEFLSYRGCSRVNLLSWAFAQSPLLGSMMFDLTSLKVSQVCRLAATSKNQTELCIFVVSEFVKTIFHYFSPYQWSELQKKLKRVTGDKQMSTLMLIMSSLIELTFGRIHF